LCDILRSWLHTFAKTTYNSSCLNCIILQSYYVWHVLHPSEDITVTVTNDSIHYSDQFRDESSLFILKIFGIYMYIPSKYNSVSIYKQKKKKVSTMTTWTVKTWITYLSNIWYFSQKVYHYLACLHSEFAQLHVVTFNVCLSIHPSTCNSKRTNERIFIKFDTGEKYYNCWLMDILHRQRNLLHTSRAKFPNIHWSIIHSEEGGRKKLNTFYVQ
jgi:hypothetical protein